MANAAGAEQMRIPQYTKAVWRASEVAPKRVSAAEMSGFWTGGWVTGNAVLLTYRAKHTLDGAKLIHAPQKRLEKNRFGCGNQRSAEERRLFG